MITKRGFLGQTWGHRDYFFPYPLRATKISVELNPFGFWWKPIIVSRNKISESAKRDGETIWYARWAWFQISYSRWV